MQLTNSCFPKVASRPDRSRRRRADEARVFVHFVLQHSTHKVFGLQWHHRRLQAFTTPPGVQLPLGTAALPQHSRQDDMHAGLGERPMDSIRWLPGGPPPSPPPQLRSPRLLCRPPVAAPAARRAWLRALSEAADAASVEAASLAGPAAAAGAAGIAAPTEAAPAFAVRPWRTREDLERAAWLRAEAYYEASLPFIMYMLPFFHYVCAAMLSASPSRRCRAHTPARSHPPSPRPALLRAEPQRGPLQGLLRQAVCGAGVLRAAAAHAGRRAALPHPRCVGAHCRRRRRLGALESRGARHRPWQLPWHAGCAAAERGSRDADGVDGREVARWRATACISRSRRSLCLQCGGGATAARPRSWPRPCPGSGIPGTRTVGGGTAVLPCGAGQPGMLSWQAPSWRARPLLPALSPRPSTRC
jgi:hypothetical protein